MLARRSVMLGGGACVLLSGCGGAPGGTVRTRMPVASQIRIAETAVRGGRLDRLFGDRSRPFSDQQVLSMLAGALKRELTGFGDGETPVRLTVTPTFLSLPVPGITFQSAKIEAQLSMTDLSDSATRLGGIGSFAAGIRDLTEDAEADLGRLVAQFAGELKPFLQDQTA